MTLEIGEILIIELITVTMTLTDELFAVDLCHTGTLHQFAVVGPESHRSSEVCEILLTLHKVDHVMLRLLVHLAAVRIWHSQDVTGKFDDHHLHAQANAETGDVVFTGILGSKDFPFNATGAKARTNHQTVLLFDESEEFRVLRIF